MKNSANLFSCVVVTIIFVYLFLVIPMTVLVNNQHDKLKDSCDSGNSKACHNLKKLEKSDVYNLFN